MSLDFAKKIEILEAKRDALEKLLVPEMDKDREHDIHQQIIAMDSQITVWVGLLPRPVDPATSNASNACECVDEKSLGFAQ